MLVGAAQTCSVVLVIANVGTWTKVQNGIAHSGSRCYEEVSSGTAEHMNGCFESSSLGDLPQSNSLKCRKDGDDSGECC